MRVAICSRVRGSISPSAAYCDTSSRIAPASPRTARRTNVLDEEESALGILRAGTVLLGKLCTGNVYINIPRGARPRLRSAALPDWAPSVAGEGFRLSGLVEAQDLVAIGARAFHPWRSHRHPRNRQTHHLRLLLEQARDVRRRHVALDDISGDDPGVTGGQVVGDSEIPLDLRHPRGVPGVDTIPVLDQVLDPALAAAAVWILVNGDGRLLPGRVHRSGPRCSRSEGERE